MVNNEMKKLGVAALGMLVREKLSIRIEELDADFMKTEIMKSFSRSQDSTALRNAETFLGSFFFIHNPRLKTDDEDEKDASFEFLHKTFYEFLIADIVLDSMLDAVDYLIEIMKPKKRGREQYKNALENPNDLNSFYFPALGGASLCTEPEIIKMAVEWKDTKIERIFGNDDPEKINSQISNTLNDIFDSHLEFIKNGTYKKLEVIEERNLLSERPYPQSCAIYLLNMLITRVLIDGKCKVEANKWSYISQYVKLNLPLPLKDENNETSKGGKKLNFQIDPTEETLLSFMSLFSVEADKGDVVLTIRERALDIGQIDLLEARIKIFDFMQDDVSRKLYALHSLKEDQDSKQQIRRELAQKGMDEQAEIDLFNPKERIEHVAGEVDNNIIFEVEHCFTLSEEIISYGAINSSYRNEVIECLDELVSIIKDSQKWNLEIAKHSANYIWRNWERICSASFEQPFNAHFYQKIIRITQFVVDLLFYGHIEGAYWLRSLRNMQFTATGTQVWWHLEVLIMIHDGGLSELSSAEYEYLLTDLMMEFGHTYKFIISESVDLSLTHKLCLLLKTLMIYQKYKGGKLFAIDLEEYLENIFSNMHMGLRIDDSELPELFRIAINVNFTDWICQFLEEAVWNQGYEIRNCRTDLLFKLLRIARKIKQRTFIIDTEKILLSRFGMEEPKTIYLYIQYMIEVADNEGMADISTEWLNISNYALNNFARIFNESIDIGIKLLLFSIDNRNRFSSDLVETCFEYALVNDERSSIIHLINLINRITPESVDEFEELYRYFSNQEERIMNFSRKLAESIIEKFFLE